MRVRWKFTLLAAALAFIAVAQAPATPTPFEVVSVRPNDGSSRNSGFRRAAPGALNGLNDTLHFLVAYAYNLRADQVEGGPGWTSTDGYDVVAEPPSPDPAATGADANELLRARIRMLLNDRFQLRTHMATKDGTVYSLVVEKGGAKGMKPSTTEGPMELNINRQNHMDCQRISMSDMAEFLADQMHGDVTDRTGIKGKYDLTLDWTTDPSADTAKPALVTAIQEQLGLKLEAARGPIEYLVIDHAEKPAAN